MSGKFFFLEGRLFEQTKEVRHINKAGLIRNRAQIKRITEFAVQNNGIPVIHKAKRRPLSVPAEHIDAVSDRLIDLGYIETTFDFETKGLRCQPRAR